MSSSLNCKGKKTTWKRLFFRVIRVKKGESWNGRIVSIVHGAFQLSLWTMSDCIPVCIYGVFIILELLQFHPLDIDIGLREVDWIEPEFVDLVFPVGILGQVEGVFVPFAVQDDGDADGGVFGE